jgi:2-desacetyl-2-hydroxyethyl bacteriochlorophyllide A dehydrogenase
VQPPPAATPPYLVGWWPPVPQIIQFSAPYRVDVVEQAPSPLPAGHVRVRTRYSGISSGTELTVYRGSNPYLNRRWDPYGRLFVDGEGGVTYPVAGIGYSEVGSIVEVADDVADSPEGPRVGQRVWGMWGHRAEAVLPAGTLSGRVLPDGVDPLAATFARVGAVALNAVLAADVHVTETVAVFGQGVIGLLASRLAVLSGAEVAAVDTLGRRLKHAEQYGARILLNPTTTDCAAELRRLTGNRGVDVAIEVSGSYRALHEAIRSVAVGGRAVAAGFYQGDAAGLRLGEEFHHNRVQIVSSQIGGVPLNLATRWDPDRLHEAFLGLMATGAVDPLGLVTHVLPVREAPAAYDLLHQRPEDALQIVLEF